MFTKKGITNGLGISEDEESGAIGLHILSENFRIPSTTDGDSKAILIHPSTRMPFPPSINSIGGMLMAT